VVREAARVVPVADRIMKTRLPEGYAMVPRADGNGAEVGGVSQDVIRNRSRVPSAVPADIHLGGP